MSDTPRTDAIEQGSQSLLVQTREALAWKFAREIERELSEANKWSAQYHGDLLFVTRQRDEYRERAYAAESACEAVLYAGDTLLAEMPQGLEEKLRDRIKQGG